jgi:hypothetical protein
LRAVLILLSLNTVAPEIAFVPLIETVPDTVNSPARAAVCANTDVVTNEEKLPTATIKATVSAFRIEVGLRLIMVPPVSIIFSNCLARTPSSERLEIA